MKICILTWRDLEHPEAGGAEVYTEQIAQRWSAAGHHVTQVSASVEGQPASEIGRGIHKVRMGNKYTVYRQARRWWKDAGQHLGYDVVIDMINTVPFRAHEFVQDTPTIALAHQTCEEIWHINAPFPAAVLGRYVLEPRWLKAYQNVPTLAVSNSTSQALKRFGLQDVTVVPEGFEQPAELPDLTKEEKPTVVWCGRQISYKRPYDVLEAARRLTDTIPDLQVWMIGGGPEVAKVRSLAPPNVSVLGFVSEEEKMQRMAAAHLHIATSVREGWGLVVSEAAAVGTPTLAYDVPGLRDSTRAANGFVIPAEPDALVTWIPQMLARWQHNPPTPLPYGGAHSWDHVAEKVLQQVTKRVKTTPNQQPLAHAA